MPRRRRLLALGLLHVLVLGAGVGAAAAREADPASPPTTAAPPVAAAPVVPVVHAQPVVRHVAPKPRHATARRAPSPRPTATTRITRRPRHVAARPSPAPAPTHRAAPTLTAQQRLMQVVARIPGYHAGEADWIIKPGLGSWGLSALGGGTVWISPDVPANRLYDVAVHEWSHLLMVKDYGGDVMSAVAAANAYFGGADLVGSERAADCMARQLGATWTHYTPCSDARWQAGARRLVARERL